MKNKLIPKHQKAGKLLKNEPVQDGTYVEQPQLNLQEQELLNFIQSNPTSEQVYFRDLAIKNEESPVQQEVLEEAEKNNVKNNFFRGYNNFRYSHPWAKGLSYTPIIGDVMDGISLAGDVNNKDYTSAAIGLGLIALPNFIQKPLQKYGKLQNIPDDVWDNLYNKAIKNDNLEEAQQLRDLHFKVKASNSAILDDSGNPLQLYHQSPNNFYVFDINRGKTGPSRADFATPFGIFTKPYKNKVALSGDNQIELYGRSISPIAFDDRIQLNNFLSTNINDFNKYSEYFNNIAKSDYNRAINIAKELKYNTDNYFRIHSDKDMILLKDDYSPRKNAHIYDTRIFLHPSQVKSSNPITYDNNGNIIPLSKRDNFNNPDIRYSWTVPISLGTLSYKFQKEKEKHKQGGTIKFNPFNKFI